MGTLVVDGDAQGATYTPTKRASCRARRKAWTVDVGYCARGRSIRPEGVKTLILTLTRTLTLTLRHGKE